jgi:heme exporter protein D
MNYGQVQHFFEMGGYGIYVWPAYAITFAVLLMNFINPWLRHRQLLRQQIPSSSIQIISSQSHAADS